MGVSTDKFDYNSEQLNTGIGQTGEEGILYYTPDTPAEWHKRLKKLSNGNVVEEIYNGTDWIFFAYTDGELVQPVNKVSVSSTVNIGQYTYVDDITEDITITIDNDALSYPVGTTFVRTTVTRGKNCGDYKVFVVPASGETFGDIEGITLNKDLDWCNVSGLVVAGTPNYVDYDIRFSPEATLRVEDTTAHDYATPTVLNMYENNGHRNSNEYVLSTDVANPTRLTLETSSPMAKLTISSMFEHGNIGTSPVNTFDFIINVYKNADATPIMKQITQGRMRNGDITTLCFNNPIDISGYTKGDYIRVEIDCSNAGSGNIIQTVFNISFPLSKS